MPKRFKELMNLYRPFRAFIRVLFHTQGFALRYYIMPLQGKNTVNGYDNTTKLFDWKDIELSGGSYFSNALNLKDRA